MICTIPGLYLVANAVHEQEMDLSSSVGHRSFHGLGPGAENENGGDSKEVVFFRKLAQSVEFHRDVLTGLYCTSCEYYLWGKNDAICCICCMDGGDPLRWLEPVNEMSEKRECLILYY